MSHRKQKAKKKNDSQPLNFIKEESSNKLISREVIESDISQDEPLFSFKYLSDESIKESNDSKFFKDFLARLRKLSQLGWKEIQASGKHQYGFEPLPVSKIKPKNKLPEVLTPDVEKVMVFRAVGDNRPFVCIRIHNIIYVLFIETKFGDIYDHD